MSLNKNYKKFDNELVSSIVKAQNAKREALQEARLERYPWIREAVNAYRNATPEQLAEAERIRKDRYGW